MSNVTELLMQAEQKLDNNQFADAASLFQQAAEAEPPAQAHLVNWSVAADQAQLANLKTLASKYPGSLECHLTVAGHLMRIGLKAQASVYCSQILGSFDDRAAVFQVRLLRFRAAIQSKASRQLVEDFLWIWRADLEAKPLALVRARLLYEIAAIHDYSFLPVLEEIANHQNVKAQVGAFVLSKIQELVALREATMSLHS